MSNCSKEFGDLVPDDSSAQLIEQMGMPGLIALALHETDIDRRAEIALEINKREASDITNLIMKTYPNMPRSLAIGLAKSLRASGEGYAFGGQTEL